MQALRQRPRGRRGAPAATIVVLSLALLVACGGDEGGEVASGDRSPRPAAGDAAAPEGRPRETARTVDPSTAGSIAGTVRLQGALPERPPLRMSSEAFCLQVHPGPVPDDALSVHDGLVADAFVWIAEGLDGYEWEPPSEPVELDQHECLFVPRVVGVMLGQPLLAKNSDPVMHNVHTKPDVNRAQNFGMPAGAPPRKLDFRRHEVLVEVVCDVHAWMRAWIGVVEHPLFAVTGRDGAFRIAGVPPGEYVLGVWHELLGERRVPVTVGEGAEVDLGEVPLGA